MRWITPGPLTPAMREWFARFPAGTETRDDAYLLQPRLPGLAVKLRQGSVLDLKALVGSPSRSSCHMAATVPSNSGESGPSPVTTTCRGTTAATRPRDGPRYTRGGRSPGFRWHPATPPHPATALPSRRAARSNSLRSASAPSTLRQSGLSRAAPRSCCPRRWSTRPGFFSPWRPRDNFTRDLVPCWRPRGEPRVRSGGR